MNTNRALDSDVEARIADGPTLIALLLLRQAVLTRNPDHPHAKVFEASRDSAIAEITWRIGGKTMVSSQSDWKNLCKEIGEDKANAEAARQLRLFADLIERPGWPEVFSAELAPIGEDPFKDTFIRNISVCLSHPWPG